MQPSGRESPKPCPRRWRTYPTVLGSCACGDPLLKKEVASPQLAVRWTIHHRLTSFVVRSILCTCRLSSCGVKTLPQKLCKPIRPRQPSCRYKSAQEEEPARPSRANAGAASSAGTKHYIRILADHLRILLRPSASASCGWCISKLRSDGFHVSMREADMACVLSRRDPLCQMCICVGGGAVPAAACTYQNEAVMCWSPVRLEREMHSFAGLCHGALSARLARKPGPSWPDGTGKVSAFVSLPCMETAGIESRR